MRLHYLLLCCLLISQAWSQSAQDDLVQNFIPNLTSNWYSGYFNLTSDKDIHYVFFESQRDKNDSLIIYIGNGPGCSSLHAMVYENGPFTVKDKGDKTFVYNNYGWNLQANVLYIETPAGVGFSTGNTSSSDRNVTKDNLDVITAFLTRFPRYVTNEIYLAGNGYAGITVPYLALAILQHNEDPVFHSKINLKGILLGNPCTNFDECYASGSEKSSFYHYEFLYNHGFMSDNYWNDFKARCGLDYNSGICYDQRQLLDTYFNRLNASSYNIYAQCYTPEQNSTVSLVNGVNEKCEDTTGILTFFNDQNVQSALHVNKVKFQVCNNDVFEKYIGNSSGSYWIYPKLIQKKQKIFIYSGDVDSMVPTIGTKSWVRKLRQELDIPVNKVWREWWVEDINHKFDQVGGMVWQLNSLTLATVRGAGLLVGRDKPKELYTILDAFINNKRLPVRK